MLRPSSLAPQFVSLSTPCLSVYSHPLSVTFLYVLIKFSISFSAGHLFLFCNLESGASGEGSLTSHYPASCIPGILFYPLQCSLKALLPVTMGLSTPPSPPGLRSFHMAACASAPHSQGECLGIFKDYGSGEWGEMR